MSENRGKRIERYQHLLGVESAHLGTAVVAKARVSREKTHYWGDIDTTLRYHATGFQPSGLFNFNLVQFAIP